MAGQNFRELKVWQNSKELAVLVYRVTQTVKFGKDFSLRDQMRRAAVSVASNIAEGDEQGTNKHSARYFYIAKGSCAEVLTQTIIAYEIGYLDENIFKDIEERCTIISKMLANLIKARTP